MTPGQDRWLDSFSLGNCLFRVEEVARNPQLFSSLSGETTAESVSYTHLTLPTIYSV